MTIVVLVALVVAGCQQTEFISTSRTLTETERTAISIDLLARRLGLRVADTTNTHVTLKNSANTVMIFTYTDGRVFVNGRPIGEVGRIDRIKRELFVSESLVSKIQAAMRSSVSPEYTVRPSGRVVIDAGHGGKDPGAIAYNGSYEKTVNLQVARKVGSLLRQRAFTVIMTRESDTFVELEQRAELANRNQAQLFVSIHADSSPNHSTRGFTVYVATVASARSHSTAQAIVGAMAQTGLASHGLRKANYRVLVGTKCPAVLVELGYLSNRSDASLLTNEAFQNRIAAAIANGISDAMSAL